MSRKLRPLSLLLLGGMPAWPGSVHALQAVELQTPATPAPVEDIVYARPFTLSEGYQRLFAPDEQAVTSGTIVVLRVDPQLVVPRNGPSPVLFLGDRIFRPLNQGHTSGHVIGLVPGTVDLAETPFWFGPSTTLEQMPLESLRVDQAPAREAGIVPFSAARLDSVAVPAIEESDLAALLRGELADLVLEFAPGEGHLARKWRLPSGADSGPPQPAPELRVP